MKIALTLIAALTSISLLSTSACAEEIVTLMDPSDSIELKKGDVALIVTASERTIVQYVRTDKWPNRIKQFYLAPRETESLDLNHFGLPVYGKRGRSYLTSKGSSHAFYDKGADRFDQRSFIPTWSNPLALAGPAKIKMVANGVVTVRINPGE